MFVDLCIQGHADVLVTGDRALLAMDIGVTIERAADYKYRQGKERITLNGLTQIQLD